MWNAIKYNCSYAMGIPTPLVAAANITSFWAPTNQLNPGLWISVYLVAPIAFNFFNVRRYGEIEFWLASIKVITCVGLVVLGFLLLMGASTAPLLLGTDPNHNIIPCTNNTSDNCVQMPGFNCKFSSPSLLTSFQTGDKRE
jgi:amino acid permease